MDDFAIPMVGVSDDLSIIPKVIGDVAILKLTLLRFHELGGCSTSTMTKTDFDELGVARLKCCFHI